MRRGTFILRVFASPTDILPNCKSRPLSAQLPKSPYFTRKRCMSILYTIYSKAAQNSEKASFGDAGKATHDNLI